MISTGVSFGVIKGIGMPLNVKDKGPESPANTNEIEQKVNWKKTALLLLYVTATIAVVCWI